MDRQKALEQFLNDTVEKVTHGLYRWRGRLYEVLPYSVTLRRHNWSGFVKEKVNGRWYAIREASKAIIKKYYPKHDEKSTHNKD